MREIRSSGSVEGVMGNHDSYSDCACEPAFEVQKFCVVDRANCRHLRGETNGHSLVREKPTTASLMFRRASSTVAATTGYVKLLGMGDEKGPFFEEVNC
jgi:hypothetical protein